jgi:hypothetical protein
MMAAMTQQPAECSRLIEQQHPAVDQGDSLGDFNA